MRIGSSSPALSTSARNSSAGHTASAGSHSTPIAGTVSTTAAVSFDKMPQQPAGSSASSMQTRM